ncbi:MAG: sensor histidine kinase [Caldilinea sp.]|nr:sensor histidine kinase [Caldilinea sp.]
MLDQATAQPIIEHREIPGIGPAVAVVDARSTIVMANDGFCHLLAQTRTQVLGRSLANLDETWFGRALSQLPSLSLLDEFTPTVSLLIGPERGRRLVLSCSVNHSVNGERSYVLVATPIAHSLPSDQLIDYTTQLEHSLHEERQEVDRSREAADGLRNLLFMSFSNFTLQQMLDYVFQQAQRLLSATGMVVLWRIGRTSPIVQPEDAQVLYSTEMDAASAGHLSVDAPILALLNAQQEPVFLPVEIGALQNAAPFRLAIPLLVEDEMHGVLIFKLDVSQLSPNAYRTVAWLADQVIVAHGADLLQQKAKSAAALQERERLAREMHDAVMQSIYSLTLFAEAGKRLVSLGQLDRLDEYLQQLSETARQALKELRLLLYELKPAVLEQVGLVEALRQRLEAVERRTGMVARLEVDGEIAFPADVEDGLYRICHEALNNALKHASATEVTIYLAVKDGMVRLDIQDNGIGFDVSDPKVSNGEGIAAMRERARQINATLSVISAPQQGARVHVLLSISNQAAQKSEG